MSCPFKGGKFATFLKTLLLLYHILFAIGVNSK